jgi:glutaminyl-peptide cyclotransferase
MATSITRSASTSRPTSFSNGRAVIRASALAIWVLLMATVLSLVDCSGGHAVSFDGDSAYSFLREQCDIGPRYPGSAGHKILQRLIVERLREYGVDVSLQPFEAVLTTGDTLYLINIIGNINTRSERRILLGAHYDTRPIAEKDPDPANRGKPIPGANDGASGVAVLLELARIFGRSDPPVGIDLVFFDGEDYGSEGTVEDYILGSAHFARTMKGYRPSAVIIVDMVGETGAEIAMEGYSRAYSPLLLHDIFAVAERLGVDAFEKRDGVPLIDDHLPFIQVGLPAVVLIDFEYPYWHTLEDTPDKCSWASLAAVGTVLVEYILQLGR